MANRKYKGRKKWTEEEIETLKRLSAKYTKSDIAKKMGRTESSITNKRQELGIDCMMNLTELWNFSQIARAVGKSNGIVNTVWVKHGFKYTKRGYFCLAEEKEVLRFMQEHPDLWDATKCDYYLFYQYPWFINKLEEDRKKSYKNKHYFWTDYEKAQLRSLKRRGYRNKEIAERLGKTLSSVKHMVVKLNVCKKAV